MSTGSSMPDLDEFLASSRDMGPCRFVRDVPQEQREAITAKVKDGKRMWSAFSRWLAQQGIDVTREVISTHFTREHPSDR